MLGPAATEASFGFAAAGAAFLPVETAIGRRPVDDARALRRLRSALRSADLVHAHGLRAGLLSGLALSAATPYVVTWHNAVAGTGVRRRAVGLLETVVARGAEVTLAVSPDLAARARAVGGRDVRLLPVPAPPLGPAAMAPAAVRTELGVAGRPLVLGVGRLHPQKAFATLVAAAADWDGRTPAPVVAIAGDGPLRAELTAAISAAGTDVRLLGHRTDIAELLAAADVVVLPSRWEGSPLVVQEAMAAGRPLVATAVGGIPDLVGDGAVLVPPGDPVALATAVSRLLDDPAAAGALAARGLARAATWADEAANVARVAAVYAELLGRPR